MLFRLRCMTWSHQRPLKHVEHCNLKYTHARRISRSVTRRVRMQHFECRQRLEPTHPDNLYSENTNPSITNVNPNDTKSSNTNIPNQPSYTPNPQSHPNLSSLGGVLSNLPSLTASLSRSATCRHLLNVSNLLANSSSTLVFSCSSSSR